MNNNDLYGVNHVYQFTIQETLKSQSFKVFTLIMCLIVIFSMPLVELTNNGTSREPKSSDISKVYILDETGMPVTNYNSIKEEYSQYENISFEYTDKSRDELEEEITKQDNGTIILHIRQETDYYNMEFIRTPEGNVSEIQLMNFAEPINQAFQANLIKSLEVTPGQMDKIEESIITDIQTYAGDIKETETKFSISFGEYYLLLAIYLVLIMLISYGGQGIASSIVVEKSTKLIEVLLIRIRPMAIIVGKVFAMLTVTLGQLLLLGVSLGISSVAYRTIFNSTSPFPETITSVLELGILENFNVSNIIIAIIIFFLGFIFYGFLAGLTGATVSKVEELQEGMIVYTVIYVIGAYMGLGLVMLGMGGSVPSAYAYLTFLLPISSIFVTPIYLLMGRISINIALLAIVILIISTILLIKFTTKVYQTIILHQGNVIKFKDLISISKISEEAR